MRKSFITWRLSFSSVPTQEQLDSVQSLLEPIIHTGKADDYGLVWQEYGLSDYIFVEPEVELTAGEIALNCLLKAHRLGKGWSVMWPGFPKSSAAGWLAGEVERAALPESLHGLTGSFSDTGLAARSLIGGLQAASFTVTVTTEAIPASEFGHEKTTLATTSRLFPTTALAEFNVNVKPALEKILARYRYVQWYWDAGKAQEQLEGFGYRRSDAGGEELIFIDLDGTTARIETDGDTVRWIEFILSEYQDPHLLGEVEFTEKQAMYEALFHHSVNQTETILGPPAFVGASGDAGFPRDQWADWAAVWVLGEGRIMVEQKHNDKELPLELCLVFAP